jgi:p21-activated kinase 1
MHVGFNSSTGEFTGMPKEWQQLLQESGITRQEQEKHPQAIMEVVKFYQETHAQGDQIWDKLGNVPAQPLGPQTPNTPGIFPGGILGSGSAPPSSFQASRPAPAPPGGSSGSRKPSIGASGAPSAVPLALQPYRPAPTPPSTVPPALDRSNSAHTAPKSPTPIDQLARAKTQRERNSAVPDIKRPSTAQDDRRPAYHHHHRNGCERSTNLPRCACSPTGESARTRERERPPPGGPAVGGPTPAVAKLQGQHAAGQATPRRREKKKDANGEDIVKRLQAICTDADPTRLYRNLAKIGQGASGGVYTAYQVGTNLSVAIKQMDLDKQPKKDLIINEILVMRSSRHPNIVNYIDSFLWKNDLWVVMEYMEGGSLTDVVTANLMTEGQIAAVSHETCRGLEHLHRHGVIHRDIKSDNVLLSLIGDIKLSE